VAPKLRIGIALAVTATAVALYGSLAGAADPDLEQRIDSASSEAELIAQRISTQSARIDDLRARASEAAAREAELRAELRENSIRSRELSDDLVAAERELEAVKARYDRALEVLSGRLVAIYKGDQPDLLTVLLDADGYEELTARAEYLEALTEADDRLADRVAALHAQSRRRTSGSRRSRPSSTAAPASSSPPVPRWSGCGPRQRAAPGRSPRRRPRPRRR
jgi:septal ring factor EnvC (AmiA/AmiB activator)